MKTTIESVCKAGVFFKPRYIFINPFTQEVLIYCEPKKCDYRGSKGCSCADDDGNPAAVMNLRIWQAKTEELAKKDKEMKNSIEEKLEKTAEMICWLGQWIGALNYRVDAIKVIRNTKEELADASYFIGIIRSHLPWVNWPGLKSKKKGAK